MSRRRLRRAAPSPKDSSTQKHLGLRAGHYLVNKTDEFAHLERICFPILALTEKFHKHGPGVNYEPLELAATIPQLVNTVEQGRSEFGKKLIRASKDFIDKVQAALPAGVEIGREVPIHNSYNIHNELHRFPISTIIDFKEFKPPKPDPHNYPILELAVTVIEMIEAVEPVGRRSTLGTNLLQISRDFIKEVQAGLPKGVEIRENPEIKAKVVSAA